MISLARKTGQMQALVMGIAQLQKGDTYLVMGITDDSQIMAMLKNIGVTDVKSKKPIGKTSLKAIYDEEGIVGWNEVHKECNGLIFYRD